MCVSAPTLLALLFSTASLCHCLGQESGEQIVRAALDPRSTAIYEGFSEGPLSRLGDAAAVAVTKLVGGKDLSNGDITRILMIIQKSFASPKIVEVQADRQPRTTLFVLKYLETLPAARGIRSKIDETRKFIEESTKSARRRQPGP